MANGAERQPIPTPPINTGDSSKRPFSPLAVLEDFKRRHPERFEDSPHPFDEPVEILLESPVRITGPNGTITFPERKIGR